LGTRVDRFAKRRLLHMPPHRLLGVARLLAQTRPLRPVPGWHHAVADELIPSDERMRAGWRYQKSGPLPSRRIEYRYEIWSEFRRRRLQLPLRMPWYGPLAVYSYLGNDLSRNVFVGGCYEPNELSFLQHSLRNGMTFVDLGANEGLFSLLAAHLVGDEGKVVAVEPSRRELARLRANLMLNRFDNVDVIPAAACEDAGSVELHIAGYEHEGLNSLGALPSENLWSSVERVNAIRLSAAIDDRAITHVDFIKIDVEGAEVRALTGALELLERDKPVLLLEVNRPLLASQGTSAEDLEQLLGSLGYVICPFSPQTGLPEEGSLPMVESANVVAVHPSSRPPEVFS